MSDPSWRDLRACADLPTAMFYPATGEHGRAAKAVCAGCPVAADCLESAMANSEEFGIWGGKSERQRRAMRYEARNGAPLGADAAHGVYRYNTGCRCNICRLSRAAYRRTAKEVAA